MTERTVDRKRIQELLGIINDSLYKLRQLSRVSQAEFLEDFRNTESAKYLFVKATEAAIDICNHLVSRIGGRAPRDYADCFAVLGELHVISPDLTRRLKQMARFRNLIVHLYWQVDDARVYEILQDDLGDLDEYQTQIAKYLQRNQSQEEESP
jgi:uncharacterized protein YutE (UPF0331/DUF86 family)